jgi:hypothetical protein
VAGPARAAAMRAATTTHDSCRATRDRR